MVFDLGANLGAWSLKVLENKKNVNLHLFEASPYTYQSLLQNMANYIDAEKLFLNQFAISSQDSFQAFNFYENHPTLSGIYRRDIKLEERLKLGVPKSISVPTTSLDSYCGTMDIKRINFIKIDVERAELDVIFGAEQLLKKGKIDYLQFEYGGTYLDAKTTLKEVFEYLQGMKYLIFKILDDKLEYKPQFLPEYENYKYSNFLAVNEQFKAKILGEKIQMFD